VLTSTAAAAVRVTTDGTLRLQKRLPINSVNKPKVVNLNDLYLKRRKRERERSRGGSDEAGGTEIPYRRQRGNAPVIAEPQKFS